MIARPAAARRISSTEVRLEHVLAVIQRGLRARRLMFLAIGTFAIAFGSWAFYRAQIDPQFTRSWKAALVAYAGAPAGVGFLLYGALAWRRGLTVLRTSPERVVWWFVRQYATNRYELGLGLDNGKLALLPLDGREGAAALEAKLASVLPNASRGYSADLEARFASNAASLRRT